MARLTIERDPPVAEALAILRPENDMLLRTFRVQLCGFPCWGYRLGGELVAVAGLVEVEPAVLEAWLAATPAARRATLPLVRSLKLTLEAHCYGRAVAVLGITLGQSPGARIARALGLARVPPAGRGDDEAEGRPDLWRRIFP